MSRSTLTITPADDHAGEAKLELVCSHGSTLAYFGQGNLKLSDDALGNILAGSHRSAFGCMCAYSLEIRRPIAAAVN